MLVGKLLIRARDKLVTIGHDTALIEAANLLRAGTDIVVVCDNAGLVAGVITKTDVVGQISHCQGGSCVTPASLVMTRNVVTCHLEDRLESIWSIMKDRGLKNVPIVDDEGQPQGVLNARDALEVLLEEVEDEELILRDYVMGVGYQ